MKHKITYSLLIAFSLFGILGGCSSTTSVGELNYAIMNNDLKAVRVGIENGANVNGTNNEKKATPLHTAALYGNVAMVKELVGAGAEVEISDCSGMTPMFYAAQSGSVAVSRYLLEQGANVNRTISDSSVTCGNNDPNGSALSVAAANNKPDVVRFLLDKGAKAGGKRAYAFALADPAREPIAKMMKKAGYRADEETARIIATLPRNGQTNSQQTSNTQVANSGDSGASVAADVATDIGGAFILDAILNSAL